MADAEREHGGAGSRIRVAIVDDHPAFRRALFLMLETEPRIEVVGEAGDGEEALKIVIESRAEVVCMDIRMPRMTGIEVTRALLAMNPALKVIGLSAVFDQDVVLELFSAGAAGFVTKGSNELTQAIFAAWSGRKYLCPELAGAMTGALPYALGQPAVRLGARERQVLQLIAEGCSLEQIAERLALGLSTVEVHCRNLMRKLNLHGIAELTRYAIDNGIATRET